MESTARQSRTTRFGPFEVDKAEGRLFRNGLPVRLQDQPLRLLLLLLDRPGEIVTREEMRSGLWPSNSFGEFDNGLNVAIRKLRTALGDVSDRPRYIETIPRKGYRFISEITVIDAVADSPPAAVALPPHSPDAGSLDLPVSRVVIPPRRRSGMRLAVVAVLLCVVVLALLVRRHFAGTEQRPETASVSGRRTIAVLTFQNSSGRQEDAWLSTALSEMFSTELAAGDQLRLVPGEDVVHARLAEPSIDIDSVSVATAKQLHKVLKADLIVSGAYATVAAGNGRQVRLDVRLQDAGTGEILSEVSGDASEQTLFHVVGEVGERLRGKLGVSYISAEQHDQVVASMPSNPEAGEFYSEGLLKLRAYDALAARDLLRRSVAAEPAFPLAHAALSEAWTRLGYDRQAVEEARKASDLSSSLLPTERLRVQARYWETTANWDKAAAAYRTLRSSFPDDLQYTVLFARSLTRAGKAKEAIEVLGEAGDVSDPELQLAVADAASALGDLGQSAAAAQTAATAARSRGQWLLLAKALCANGSALEGLARYQQALAATEEARAIYKRAGDRLGVASTLEVQGTILSDQGNLAAALTKYQQQLEIVRDVGNKRGEASALNNMALVLSLQGDPAQSRVMWEQAAAAFRELGDKSNVAVVLVNIGGALQDQGELAAAKRNYEQARGLAREIRDNNATALAMKALGIVLDAEGSFTSAEKILREASAMEAGSGQGVSAESLIDLGDVMQHRGELAGAATAYRDALKASQANGEKSYSAYANFGLGRLALLAADLGEAQRKYVGSLQSRKELGEVFTIAETDMALAEVALEQGRAVEAEASLRSVQQIFDRGGRRDDSALASALLVRALLAQGKVAEAAQALESVGPAARIENLGSRLSILIAQGSVEVALGHSSAAKKTLQLAIYQAQRAQYREKIIEGQLTLLAAESASSGRASELQKLARLADRWGFRLLAGKCRAGN